MLRERRLGRRSGMSSKSSMRSRSLNSPRIWRLSRRFLPTTWSASCASRPSHGRSQRNTATAADLIARRFDRPAPDQLRVTDITEHPPGKARWTAVWSWMCSLPSGGRLVHRHPPGHPAGHPRPGDGDPSCVSSGASRWPLQVSLLIQGRPAGPAATRRVTGNRPRLRTGCTGG
jgi:hypothetical protein